MPVVLGCEELIFGCERPIDFSRVERAAIGSRSRIEIRGPVGEGDNRFTLCECVQGKFRDTQDTPSGQCKAPLQKIAARSLLAHTNPPLSLDSRWEIMGRLCPGDRSFFCATVAALLKMSNVQCHVSRVTCIC